MMPLRALGRLREGTRTYNPIRIYDVWAIIFDTETSYGGYLPAKLAGYFGTLALPMNGNRVPVKALEVNSLISRVRYVERQFGLPLKRTRKF